MIFEKFLRSRQGSVAVSGRCRGSLTSQLERRYLGQGFTLGLLHILVSRLVHTNLMGALPALQDLRVLDHGITRYGKGSITKACNRRTLTGGIGLWELKPLFIKN